MKMSSGSRKLLLAPAAAFAVASLGSFAHRPDPSLLAAPVYEPEKWNDVSNENLLIFSGRHGRVTRAIMAESLRNNGETEELTFPRKAHARAEKALYTIRFLNSFMTENRQYNIAELAHSLSARLGLPVYETTSAMMDARDMYKPMGIQNTNNCYAYAVDDGDPEDAQKTYQAGPGERTRGEDAYKISPLRRANYADYIRQTIEGNVSDGMVFTGKKMESRQGYYRAALYMRPAPHDTDNMLEAIEYHYIRQNRDGRWSHKYGALNVTDTDYGGNPITDPASADMGKYRFIGYFLVPEGGLDVGPPEEKPRKSASRPARPAAPSPA